MKDDSQTPIRSTVGYKSSTQNGHSYSFLPAPNNIISAINYCSAKT